MQLEAMKHLWDIQQAAELALSFVEHRTLDDYLDDELLRAGVERKLTIVGEAMVRLRDTALDVFSKIADSRRIIAFRNLVVHGYDVLDNEAVWDILKKNVPALVIEVRSLRELGGTAQNTDVV